MIARISWSAAKRDAGSVYGFSGRSFFVPKAECLALPLGGAWHQALAVGLAAYFRKLRKALERHG